MSHFSNFQAALSVTWMNSVFSGARLSSMANLHSNVVPPVADVHFVPILQYGTVVVADW